MELYFGVQPESFKLTTGNYSVFSPKNVKSLPHSASLVCGRNDTAAFQIILCADAPFALNIGECPWFSQDEYTDTLRICADMPLKTNISHIGMHLCDDAYFRADSILDDEVVEFGRDGIASLWVELSAPANTAPDIYKGNIKIYNSCGFADEVLLGEIAVTAEVLPYIIPDNKNNGFHLDLWQHLSNIARKHEVKLWSDNHFKVLEAYCRSLGELGVKSVTVVASEIPWNGQSCRDEKRFKANLFEYSIIPVTRKNGVIRCDFTYMQRYIDLCAKYGVDETISVFGLVNVWDTNKDISSRTAPDYPDGLHVRVFDEDKGCYGYIRTAAELDAYIKAIETYFINTSQISKVRISADEPSDIEAYRASLSHIKSVAPSFTYKTAINHAEFIEEFGKDISDFAPYIAPMVRMHGELMRYRREMPNKRFLYYVCCGPEYPNTFLRSELVESYYIGVLAAYAEMDGFLRWNYTVWPDEPRNDIRYGPFPAGDVNFVYPSSSGGVLLSLRWKALRKGIKFFMLLNEAKKRGLTAVYEKACEYVMRDKNINNICSGFNKSDILSLDYSDYRNAEELLLRSLSV